MKPRETFHIHIKALEKDIRVMGNMVIHALEKSIKALQVLDKYQAKAIIHDDILINNKRWDIEEKCVSLIATQQPVAKDLRELIAVITIVTDMERMGDHAQKIAKIIMRFDEGETLPKPLVDIPQMADIATEMLNKALESFLKKDVEMARKVCAQDDQIDALYYEVYKELMDIVIKKPDIVSSATHLIWVAHDLERIADYSTNICERVIFLVTGEYEEINVS